MTSIAANTSAREIVSSALGIDVGELQSSSKIYDFPQWDSFGHLQLVQALEAALGVSIEDEDTFERLTKFSAIVEYVEQHVAQTSGAKNV